MKKIILIIMCSLLMFSCNKSENKEVTVDKAVDSAKTKTEKTEKPKPAKEKAKKSTTEKTEPKVNKEVKKSLKGINPEIKSITVGNDGIGFTYTEDLTQKKLKHKCPTLTNDLCEMSMWVSKIKRGEGEMDIDDCLFEEIENAIYEKKDLPLQVFASNARLINIGKYRFVEYIILHQFELTEICLKIELRSTTPKNKIIILFEDDSKRSLRKIIPSEAPLYFSRLGISKEEAIKELENISPEWNNGINNDPEYQNMEKFCKKLIAGTCESKTAQDIFNTYQEFVKSMKIE